MKKRKKTQQIDVQPAIEQAERTDEGKFYILTLSQEFVEVPNASKVAQPFAFSDTDIEFFLHPLYTGITGPHGLEWSTTNWGISEAYTGKLVVLGASKQEALKKFYQAIDTLDMLSACYQNIRLATETGFISPRYLGAEQGTTTQQNKTTLGA